MILIKMYLVEDPKFTKSETEKITSVLSEGSVVFSEESILHY